MTATVASTRRCPVGRCGVLATACAMLALAACGSDGGSTQTASIGGASGKELAAEQILHIGNGAEIQTLDPQRGEEVQGANVLRDLFEGLINEAADGDLIPGAAESLDGSATTAGRYVSSCGRKAAGPTATPSPPRISSTACGAARIRRRCRSTAFILSPIVNADAIAAGNLPPEQLGVRAIDDHTLEIELANPTPYFLGLLAHAPPIRCIARRSRSYGDQFTRPGNLVGNGAYVLAEWVVQSHIRLVRNPYYWDNAHTELDEVWYYPTENSERASSSATAPTSSTDTYTVPTSQLAWIRDELGRRADHRAVSRQLLLRFQRHPAAVQGQPEAAPGAGDGAGSGRSSRDAVLGAGQKSPPTAGCRPSRTTRASSPMGARGPRKSARPRPKRLYAEAGYSAEQSAAHRDHVQHRG